VATTERDRVALYALGGLALLAVAILVWNLWPTPQMGIDDDVFRTVDALYTAVRGKDERRLALCEQRLQGYRTAGKLPGGAADHLDGIIQQARGGGWDSAVQRLYTFMLAQRRDGAEGQHEPRKGKK
jgi:hypothetical protein